VLQRHHDALRLELHGQAADGVTMNNGLRECDTRTEFGAYLKELFASDEARSGATGGEGFETITESVTQEKDGEVTAWAWWKTQTQEGAGLMKAGPDGVRLERLAYYTRLEPS